MVQISSIQPDTVVSDLPDDVYFAHPAVSRSDLEPLVWGTPWDAWARKYGGQHDETTTAMSFGRVFHTACLEPARFLNKAVVFDTKTRGMKLSAAQRQNPDRIYVSQGEQIMLAGMIKSLHKKESAWLPISQGKVEQSVFWKDKDSGLEVKGRIDVVSPSGYVYDVKSTISLANEHIKRECFDRGYIRQAAWYLRGLETVHDRPFNSFAHIWVHKKPPYRVRVVEIPDKLLSEARDELARLSEEFAKHLETYGPNEPWPDYQDEIESIF